MRSGQEEKLLKGEPMRRRARGAASYQRGLRAEHLAGAWLQGHGWTILIHRARTRWGEIDLVARRGGMIVFCEVKCRPHYEAAAESLGRAQMRRLMNAAASLCATHPGWIYDEMRFDVMLVTADDAVHHIADAFRLE
jgi:putative endonuclease